MKKPYATMRFVTVTDEHLRQPGTFVNSKPKAPPFDFAQGRLSRKGREKWGTRHPEEEKLLDDCRILVRTFDYVVKAGQSARRKGVTGRRLGPFQGEK